MQKYIKVNTHTILNINYKQWLWVFIPFDDSMRPSKGIRTVHVAYAYDAPNGQTAILQVNHCLDFTSTMENSIVCTNQARANNIIINDCPKLFDLTHTSTQSVIIPDNSIEIPIHYHGPVPYIPIRYPTDEDLDGVASSRHRRQIGTDAEVQSNSVDSEPDGSSSS